MVEFIGRWSMLDVFVDTFTVALVQLQPLMSVEPGPGVLFFAAVVVLTMIAAESFDPRLIWDSRKRSAEDTMAEDPERPDIPQATVVPRRRARISVVWIIPILAAVVAIGIAVQRILSEGPTITIVFKIAEGIEAGKTFVKYKDVNIGQVTAVRLSADYAKVEVTAKIAKSAAGLIVEDAKFWVVEPRVTLSGVSGLGTLLSGNYIGFEIGKSDKKQRTFTGLETPPIITYGQPGRQFVLKADNLGSLGIGSPVYYRRLQAGQVIAYELARDGKAIDIRIFVNAPYDQYVNPGTRFWNASGIDVSVGAGGVDVRTESLVALIAGGLAFDTPPVRGQGRARRRRHDLHPLRRPGHRDEAAGAPSRRAMCSISTSRCAGCPWARPSPSSGCRRARSPRSGSTSTRRPRAFAGAWRSWPTPSASSRAWARRQAAIGEA